MAGSLRRLSFNLWYFLHPPWDSGISPPELMEFINDHHPGRALDLGCGTGTNVITLAQKGWAVTGVDFAPRAISIAQRKIRAAGVSAEVHVGDVTQLSGIEGPFDFILDLGCFHGLESKGKEKYLLQLDRVCNPSGMWLLYGFFKQLDKLSGPGLSAMDVDKVLERFELVSRKDGWDRRKRPSAYFLLKKNDRLLSSPP